MKTSEKQPGSDQIRRAIRAEMARRDVATRDVAAATGYAEGYVHNVIEGWYDSSKARAAIEQFLGNPFWIEAKQTNT